MFFKNVRTYILCHFLPFRNTSGTTYAFQKKYMFQVYIKGMPWKKEIVLKVHRLQQNMPMCINTDTLCMCTHTYAHTDMDIESQLIPILKTFFC